MGGGVEPLTSPPLSLAPGSLLLRRPAVSSFQLHCLSGACPASSRGVMGGVSLLLYRIPQLPQASAARPRSSWQGGSRVGAELLGSLTGKSERILPSLPGHKPPASSPEYCSTGIFARFRKIIAGENPVLLATVGGFSGPSQSPDRAEHGSSSLSSQHASKAGGT